MEVGVVEVLGFSKNLAASEVDGVGVGVEEVEGGAGMTVEILSPTRTYFPSWRPACTSSQGMYSPLSS